MRIELPGLGVVEGEPHEIASLLERLHLQPTAPASPPPAQPPTLEPAPPPPVPEADAREHNATLIQEYSGEPGVTVGTRRRYASAVREFATHLLGNRPLEAATTNDVRAYERWHRDHACTHRQATPLRGRYGQAAPRWRCRQGYYDWQPTPPATCNRHDCPLFEAQGSGFRFKLCGLKQFYDFLMMTGRARANPVPPILARVTKTTTPNLQKRKYAPSHQEVQALVHHALPATQEPRNAVLLAVLAKWGRRRGHTLQVHVEDLVGITQPPDRGAIYCDFEGARARTLKHNQAGRTKLVGNLISPIDPELATLLRTYLTHRAQRWPHLAPDSGFLFPGFSGGPYYPTYLQRDVFQATMRHLMTSAQTPEDRRRWRDHSTPGHRTYITPHCLRHYFTTHLEELGVPREDRMTLRGDKLPGAMEDYRHLTPQLVCQKYRASSLSLSEVAEAVREFTATVGAGGGGA